MPKHLGPIKIDEPYARQICWPKPGVKCLKGTCVKCRTAPQLIKSAAIRHYVLFQFKYSNHTPPKGDLWFIYWCGVADVWYERVKVIW